MEREPAFRTHVGREADDHACTDVHDLAEMFGAAVVEPTWWPPGTRTPRYLVTAKPPPPLDAGAAHTYRIVADLPGSRTGLLVLGTDAPVPHTAGRDGWDEVEELAAVRGIAHAGSGHVVVQRDGLAVHLAWFPSQSEAVMAARSLRRVDPPS